MDVTAVARGTSSRSRTVRSALDDFLSHGSKDPSRRVIRLGSGDAALLGRRVLADLVGAVVHDVGAVVRDLIEGPDDPIYLSAISAWEIAVKHGRGKLLLPEPPDRYVPRLRDEMGVEELPLREKTILRVGRLPGIHGDPFDRALVSQAIATGMTILTPDEAIREYPVPTIW